mmetsp:Transcript_9090/g.15070  ORF Transcript_9090/g.15070 Transcript_9090/m.15070 type:complete len:223 (+) Transcript_9090:83-751(+)
MLRVSRNFIRVAFVRSQAWFRPQRCILQFCTHVDGMMNIKMPAIMSDKEGRVNSWSKHAGEPFETGDVLCEIALPSATLTIDAKEPGIMANILVHEYETVDANTPIAVYALSKDYYMNYLAKAKSDMESAHMKQLADDMVEEKGKRPDTKVLMRVIKHMINSGTIEADIASQVLSLARKGNIELMNSFEASFDGVSFNDETFDEKFFIENIVDILADAQKVM